jgi:antitoxin MazE
MMFMETTIQKWGNSHAIRIPKVFLDELNLHENEKVEIELNSEGISIKKFTPQSHVTLQEHLESFFGKPLQQVELNLHENEMEWGASRGEEE